MTRAVVHQFVKHWWRLPPVGFSVELMHYHPASTWTLKTAGIMLELSCTPTWELP